MTIPGGLSCDYCGFKADGFSGDALDLAKNVAGILTDLVTENPRAGENRHVQMARKQLDGLVRRLAPKEIKTMHRHSHPGAPHAGQLAGELAGGPPPSLPEGGADAT